MPYPEYNFVKIKKGVTSDTVTDDNWRRFKLSCIGKGSTMGSEIARFINWVIKREDAPKKADR